MCPSYGHILCRWFLNQIRCQWNSNMQFVPSTDIMLWKVFKLRDCVYSYVDTISGALQLSPDYKKPIVQCNPCVTLCLHLLHEILLEQVRFDLKAPWMPSYNVPPSQMGHKGSSPMPQRLLLHIYSLIELHELMTQMRMLFSHGPCTIKCHMKSGYQPLARGGS